eukprot:955418_1
MTCFYHSNNAVIHRMQTVYSTMPNCVQIHCLMIDSFVVVDHAFLLDSFVVSLLLLRPVAQSHFDQFLLFSHLCHLHVHALALVSTLHCVATILFEGYCKANTAKYPLRCKDILEEVKCLMQTGLIRIMGKNANDYKIRLVLSKKAISDAFKEHELYGKMMDELD